MHPFHADVFILCWLVKPKRNHYTFQLILRASCFSYEFHALNAISPIIDGVIQLPLVPKSHIVTFQSEQETSTHFIKKNQIFLLDEIHKHHNIPKYFLKKLFNLDFDSHDFFSTIYIVCVNGGMELSNGISFLDSRVGKNDARITFFSIAGEI